MNQLLRLFWVLFLRRGAPLGLFDTSRLPFTVVPADLDVLGHMNNGVFHSLLDLGRVDYMRRAGLWQKLNQQGWYPVVTLSSMRFRRSLNLWQRFQIETAFLGHDETTMFVEQRFVRRGELLARAVVGARFLKKKGGIASPRELLDLAGYTGPDVPPPAWVSAWSEGVRTWEV